MGNVVFIFNKVFRQCKKAYSEGLTLSVDSMKSDSEEILIQYHIRGLNVIYKSDVDARSVTLALHYYRITYQDTKQRKKMLAIFFDAVKFW